MAQPRSRTPLIVGIIAAIACLGLVILIVLSLVLGGVLFLNSDTDDESDGHGQGQAGSTASSGQLETPPGVEEDQPYLELGSDSDGPVVDVYIDFLCPHCKTFQEAQGEDLQAMALDGEITLRMHPRPMLDATSSPVGYSGRAANAAVCAYAEDPEQWFPAESALFEAQPGAEGLTDDELAKLVDEATGLDVTTCITEGTYLPWVEDVVEPEAQSSTQGTPTVLLDGEEFPGDVSSPGSVKEAVEAA